MNRVLCVTEYQSIRKAEVFCAAERTVTAAQFQQLERFNEQSERQRRIKAFQHGARNTLIAQNYVGVIHLGGWQVEVLPKIEAPQYRTRQNLLQMVASALNLQLHGGELASLDRASHSILEVLIRLYCDMLWQAIHKGVVRRYQSQQDNLVTLRGRLDVTEQLKRNLARPDRLHCTFDEFTPDNPLNRALKAALRVLHRLVSTETSSRSIAELLFCFDGVTDVPASAIQWEQATTDRLSERYAPLIRMARLFVEGESPDLTSGGGDGFAVLFDMNQLFEQYIGRRVQHVCAHLGLITQLQGPKRHLALRDSGTPCFELRPDIVITESGKHLVVIDTKWKRIRFNGVREEISTSDLYQMFAYAKQYRVPNVILLYPHHAELGEWKPCLNTYQFREPESERNGHALKVASLPLVDLKLVDEHLKSILNFCI
ncbi:McrC family protein [Diaphorobacter caeni]|uniref:McrC family protein n=1 Tax=Diaphorobacter caeni TaxID=2784387 RepID=UPI00188FAABE|nr:McrC family protein [Diaphorobacter caeni]MBF5007746.1 McrC family protein [Diaphorobacter caeni]